MTKTRLVFRYIKDNKELIGMNTKYCNVLEKSLLKTPAKINKSIIGTIKIIQSNKVILILLLYIRIVIMNIAESVNAII